MKIVLMKKSFSSFVVATKDDTFIDPVFFKHCKGNASAMLRSQSQSALIKFIRLG